MRLPHQVLGFPYKKDENGHYLYAVLLRNSKKEVWQGIAEVLKILINPI